MIQYLRSLLFVIQMYVMMPIIGLIYAPHALMSRQGAHRAPHAYCAWVFKTLRIMCNLEVEVRGTPPTEPCLIAAKHQSFLDIMMIYNAVPNGFFVMKYILKFAPVLGFYAQRLNCVPVKRGKRSEAIRAMLAQVASGEVEGGQLIIYPQGTRVAPGDKRPYKVGTAALYEQMQQPCYPVAINVGVFWPKRGFLRKPGKAVVEFLEPIQPGLDKDTFMKTLEEQIETHSDRLMQETGFQA